MGIISFVGQSPHLYPKNHFGMQFELQPTDSTYAYLWSVDDGLHREMYVSFLLNDMHCVSSSEHSQL